MRGFELHDGKIVVVPPHADEAVNALVTLNDKVTAVGIVKAGREGEVSLSDIRPLRLHLLEVGGEKYAV